MYAYAAFEGRICGFPPIGMPAGADRTGHEGRSGLVSRPPRQQRPVTEVWDANPVKARI